MTNQETKHFHTLEAELERRKAEGMEPMTRAEIDKELRLHGYRLDGRASCFCNARYTTGDLAGETYPSAHIRVVSLVSGKSYASIESPRDHNLKWLQANRDRLFYVTSGHIVEI